MIHLELNGVVWWRGIVRSVHVTYSDIVLVP